jgi:hypothetical protein
MAPDKPATLPRLPSPLHAATVQVTPPVMVKELVDPLPDVHQIEAALIGIKTVDGNQCNSKARKQKRSRRRRI